MQFNELQIYRVQYLLINITQCTKCPIGVLNCCTSLGTHQPFVNARLKYAQTYANLCLSELKTILQKETLATDIPSKHLASFLSIRKLLKYQLYFSTSLSMSITK